MAFPCFTSIATAGAEVDHEHADNQFDTRQLFVCCDWHASHP
jgi:hypothetical protein